MKKLTVTVWGSGHPDIVGNAGLSPANGPATVAVHSGQRLEAAVLITENDKLLVTPISTDPKLRLAGLTKRFAGAPRSAQVFSQYCPNDHQSVS